MGLKRVNDIIDEYPGEWVAVEVVEYDSRDPDGEKDIGKLVAHSVNEDEVWKAIRGHKQLVAVAYSGPLIDPDMAVVL
jgi:hypothetical protein